MPPNATLSQLAIGINTLFAGWCPGFSLTFAMQNLQGKNAIVTGSNTGIGFETAKALAEMGATVYLACRTQSKAAAARDRIIKDTGNDNVHVMIIDMSDFKSVNAFVEAWGSKPVDILINNAGLTNNKFFLNPDGFEASLATNYLSSFLLTMKLLPLVTSYGRIVNVSSLGNYRLPPALYEPSSDFDGVEAIKAQGYKLGDTVPTEVMMTTYGRSKFYQIVFTRELQAYLDDPANGYVDKHIVTHACHPGFVQSDIWQREAGQFTPGLQTRITMWAVRTMGINNAQGAATQIWLATAPEAALNGGGFWDRQVLRSPNYLIQDEEKRKAVWRKSAEATGIKL